VLWDRVTIGSAIAVRAEIGSLDEAASESERLEALEEDERRAGIGMENLAPGAPPVRDPDLRSSGVQAEERADRERLPLPPSPRRIHPLHHFVSGLVSWLGSSLGEIHSSKPDEQPAEEGGEQSPANQEWPPASSAGNRKRRRKRD
jgi:hypothetical protein